MMILRAALLGVLVTGATVAVRGESPHVSIFLVSGLVGVLLSLLRQYFREATRPVIPAVLVPLNGVVIALLLGGVAYLELPRESMMQHARESSRASVHANHSGTILYGRNISLFVERHAGIEFRGVVVINHRDTPSMSYHPEAYWNTTDETLVVPTLVVPTRGESVESSLSTSGIHGLHRPPGPAVFARLHRDMMNVLGVLNRPFPSLSLAASVLSLAFVLSLIWTGARLTRWPLANVVVALGVVLAVLGTPRFLETFSVPSLVRTWFAVPPLWPLEEYAVPLVWTVMGVILLATGFFLPGFRRWQREIAPEGDGP